ncbi:MAG: hypothetical protein HY818_10355 [Acetobacterium woodii]|nr:hypothetical protein [Acetobacterium woodii]
MGRQFKARCNQCQTEFDVREGGGFSFYLLHCDTCGEEKVIGSEEIKAKINDQNPALAKSEKIETIEAIAGACENGYYRFSAKARCPKCHSDDYSPAVDANGQVRMTFYD